MNDVSIHPPASKADTYPIYSTETSASDVQFGVPNYLDLVRCVTEIRKKDMRLPSLCSGVGRRMYFIMSKTQVSLETEWCLQILGWIVFYAGTRLSFRQETSIRDIVITYKCS